MCPGHDLHSIMFRVVELEQEVASVSLVESIVRELGWQASTTLTVQQELI
jgi:hypothetical protein